jgi:cytochrome c oxidase assembly protein subunit 15
MRRDPRAPTMMSVPADLAAPPTPSPASRYPGVRRVLKGAVNTVLSPSPVAMRRIALAGVIAIAGSIATGGAVRLSQSGLGCSTWPDCTSSSLVAATSHGSSLLHAWVEFGNRLFVAFVMVVSVLVLVAAWRFRPQGRPLSDEPGGHWPVWRHRLVWLAAVQPLGVLLQALLGGIVVLTKLNPVAVSIHFLATIAILAAAVALHARFARGSLAPGARVRPELRWLSAALIAVTTLMIAAGTVVTGTGPLAGASDTPRYQLPLEGVTQFHADIGWLLGGLTVAVVVGLRLGDAPPMAVRRGWVVLGMIGLQGIIGYAQYFSGLPAGLVWVHVLGASLVWIAALRLFYALRPAPLGAPETA